MIISIIGIAALSASAQTSCLAFPSGSSAPNGYGASWDVFSAGRELLVQVNCPTTGTSLTMTVGKGDATQYVWNEAYTYEGGWVKKILSGTPNNGWIAGSGSVVITAPSNASVSIPFYFVGYVCTNRGTAGWKCGCATSACTASTWQLQGYTGPSQSGTVCTQNGICEIGETVLNCPADCQTAATSSVVAPAISPNGGSFTTTQSVTLTTATPNATIRYTTNSSLPTASSTLYSGPISISQTTTIKAKAFKSGLMDSVISIATFTKNSSALNGPADIIVIEGDSMSNGGKGSPTDPRRAGDWVNYISAYVSWYASAQKFNIAASAEKVSQMLAQYPTQARPHKPAAGKKAYYIIMGGINDLGGKTDGVVGDADAIYANLKSLWALARADGFTVVAITVTPFYPSNSPNQQVANTTNEERKQLNALIVSDPSKYDLLVRADQLFASTMPGPTDQYFADRIHVNEAGAKKIAEAIANSIK